MPELLCPAGNEETLIEAVGAGADAVYFGGDLLNARMSADNFTAEKIEKYSLYCKLRNVKTYLTLNTVVSDVELKKLEEYIKFINSTDVSGVIVQSMGLAHLIKSIAPDLPIHASTQLTVHSLKGAVEMKNAGFERVVLSRELSKQNIGCIVKNSGVETECFIHGALCMCYSGQCYFSSVIGTRSGNRGRCAQPCRQKYKNGYELSLKDLSMAENFTEFLELGVTSFKIEGRLKSKEYVSGVCSVYRKLIDEKRNATVDETDFLKALFSRQGFTNLYFLDAPSKKMFGIRTEKDKKLSEEITVPVNEKKIPACFRYEFTKDCMSLTAECKGTQYTTFEDAPSVAKSKPLAKGEFEQRLLKTGGTDFAISSISGNFQDGLFAPVSIVNSLRRNALAGLLNKLSQTEKRPFYPFDWSEHKENSEPFSYNLHFLKDITNIGSLSEKFRHIWVPLISFKEKLYKNLGISLPRIIKDDEQEYVLKLLIDAKEKGITKVLCHTPGQISIAKDLKLEPYCSFTFNVFNSYDALYLKNMGAKEITLSPELSFKAIENINKPVPTNLVCYGKLPVMVTENCIIKNADKCVNYKGWYYLTDKLKMSFPVFCEYKHRNIILNSVPINLCDKTDFIKNCGVSGADILISDEKDPIKIIKEFLSGKRPNGNFTRGLYGRKVD